MLSYNNYFLIFMILGFMSCNESTESVEIVHRIALKDGLVIVPNEDFPKTGTTVKYKKLT